MQKAINTNSLYVLLWQKPLLKSSCDWLPRAGKLGLANYPVRNYSLSPERKLCCYGKILVQQESWLKMNLVRFSRVYMNMQNK